MKFETLGRACKRVRSPSPRRAWIEMLIFSCIRPRPPSPSPRRAWIEMVEETVLPVYEDVALPTEGVD